MKKEYVVVRIDAASDGAPYVIASLSLKKDMSEKTDSPPSPFGTGVMGFSNMDDMMKGLNKMISGGPSSNLTSIKLDMHEYKTMNLSVGDKVFLEMSRAETSGI